MSKGQPLPPKLPKTRQPYKKVQSRSSAIQSQVNHALTTSAPLENCQTNADWLRLAFEANSLGKWEHTLATGLIRFDEQARRHYGFTSHTVTLDLMRQQIHPDDLPRLAGEIAATLAPDSDGSYVTEYRVIHPDGSLHWLAVQTQVYFEGEGRTRQPTIRVGASQDITARKATEHAHRQYARRLEILHAIDLGIMNAGSVPEIITTALSQIRVFFGCQQAAALLFDIPAQELLIYASHEAESAIAQQGDRYPLPPNFLESLGTTQVTVIDDLHALATVNPLEQWVNHHHIRSSNIRSSLRAFFLQQGQPLGLLVLDATTPAYFTAEQQAIAAEIATQIAIAIQQQQLSAKLAQHIQTVEEMQQFLQATLDGFPAHTAVLDPQGAIITVNRPWKSFAAAQNAQSPTYFVGTNYLTVCDTAVGPQAADAAAAAAGIRAVITGAQDNFYLGYTCHHSLREQWFMLRVTPFAEPAPRRVVVAHIDITERKLAEIAEHEQRLLAEALRDSLAALTASLEVETVLQQLLAYSATVIPSEAGAIILFEEGQGRVAYARGHTPEAEAFFKTNLLALAAELYGHAENQQAYYLAADTQSTPHWISFPVTAWIQSSIGVPIVVQGQPIGLLTADSAIPNRFQPKDAVHLQTFAHYAALALENAHHVNQLEQRVQRRTAELQAAKARLEAILNNSTDGIVLVNSDLSIQLTNTSFQNLFGAALDAYDGQPLLPLIHPEDRERVRAFMTTVSAEEQGRDLELRAQRLDGTLFDAELSASLIKGDGIVCTVRDITERKAQERQLRYHASLQENVSDAVIVTDLAFRIQSWNRAAERIYGWCAAETMGKSTTELLQTRFVSPTGLIQSRQQLHEQGWWQGEIIQQCKDGTQRHLLGSVTTIKDTRGTPFSIVAINHDITERKQAEEALQQSAVEIHDLYNHAPCGYHSLNDEGMIVQINDTELRWLGYERAEVIQRRRFTDFLTPESKVTFAKNFPLFKTRGWINDLEFDLVRKDGSLFHILLNSTAIYDQDGHYLMSRSSLFDITELKRAQQAMRESEMRYRLLAENVLDVIVKYDTAGRCTFVTPSCYPLLGYRPAEFMGRASLEIVHPEDQPSTTSTVAQAVNTGRSAFTMTQRIRHKAGYYIWVESTNSIIRDPLTGQFMEVISVIRDISERKRTEAILNVRVEEEREFQGYLKALHEITIELTQLDDLDSFYRRAVELGVTRLGFDRMALFLYDEKTGQAVGTYGADPQRMIVSESPSCFTPKPSGIMMRAFTSSERFCFAENVPLSSGGRVIGAGWNAATILWNGAQRLGWLVVDNLLEQKPASKPLLNALGLYGMTVGTLLAQKQMQMALYESEARYRLLAENISDVVMRSDEEAVYLYVSPSSRTVMGYEPAELVGQPSLAFLHPDDFTATYEQAAAAIQQKRADLNQVLRFRHKQGHYVWIESNIRIIYAPQTGAFEGFIATSRDISERQQAAAALKASEEKYRRLIDTMRGALIMYDTEDRVSYINDRACELLGYERAEIMGKQAYEYVDASATEVVKAQLAQRRRMESSSYEVLAKRKDGSPLHLLVSGSPLVDTQGLYSGCFVIAVDITVQKQAETTLRQALAKEKELGELKSRFVSMASHEFRTPLATILALTETLSAYRHKLPDEQIEQRLDRIKEQISHLKDIMEDVLLLSRMQARRIAFHPIELDLDALCRDLLDEFASPSTNQQRLHYRCHGDIHPVKVDQKLMRQIISNLLSNAVKYSPADKPIQLSLSFTEEAFIVTVRDEGIGISEADLKHLFEPFHRATNVGTISGTGLGLVITKEAVELHGGTITVDSQVTQGTTCTVRIPCPPTAPAQDESHYTAVVMKTGVFTPT